MAIKEHQDLTCIHIVHEYAYTDATARNAATGLTDDDEGKVARQTDNQTWWVLVDHTGPTWKELTNDTVPPDLDVKVSVSATDTTAGFLNDELTVSEGTNATDAIEKSITSPSGDEKLNIQFDETKISITESQISDLSHTTDTFASVHVDGALVSTGAPTLDFDSTDFLVTESPADDFDITVKDSGIDHDQTTNYVANEHIDWTAPGAGTIDPSNYVDTDTTDHTLLSNIGTNTHAQIDTHIASVSNPHSVTHAQTGPVADEHIPHSTIDINTTEGIQGGGNIAADRTLKLDINGLTVDATPDSAADYIATYDASTGLHKKVLLNDLPGGGDLDDLDNVDTTGKANCAILQWDSTAGKWVDSDKFKAADGSKTAPGHSFCDAPDTGMWREGTGDLSFAVDGNEYFEIQADGRIIASSVNNANYETKVTSNQVLTNKKYVDDAITAASLSADFSDGGEAGGAARSLGNTDHFDLSLITNNTTRIKIAADGDIGIGAITGDPLAQLHVQPISASQEAVYIQAQDSQTANLLEVQNSVGTATNIINNNGELTKIGNTSPNVGDILEWSGSKWVSAAPSAGSGVTVIEKSSASSTTTSSTSYTAVSGLTETPASGTYLVTFSASGRGQSNMQEIQYCLYSGGSIIAHTERDFGFDVLNDYNEDQRRVMHTQAVITVNGSQAIETRWKTNTSTANMFERSMILMKVS